MSVITVAKTPGVAEARAAFAERAEEMKEISARGGSWRDSPSVRNR